MPAKLKPCPFCGKKRTRLSGIMGIITIKCRNCGASIETDCSFEPLQAAYNNWNRRAKSKE